MRALSPSANGILCLVAGIAIFSVQDLILKLLSGEYPLHQAMVIRSLTAMPFMLMIVRYFDGTLATITTPGWWKMFLRGALNFVAYTCYYLGLAYLPMATTVGLFFTAPLFITISAAILLREKVTLAAWVAVAAGFAAVLLVLKPEGGSLGLAAALPVLGAFGYALSMIAARPLGRTESASAMAFWGNLCFLALALGLTAVYGTGRFEGASHPSLAFLTRGWVTPTAKDLGLMMACGVIAAMGLTLLTQAYRVAQSSVVAPFEYTFMFWGLLWGWLFWGDLLEPSAWIGIGIIIATGLYVVRSEGAAKPPSPAPAQAPALVAAVEEDRNSLASEAG